MRDQHDPQAAVISVVSGKGGVGKSVVAANLALHWARSGHRVGLIDADLGQASCALLLGPCADEVRLVSGLPEDTQQATGWGDSRAVSLALDGPLTQLAGEVDFIVLDAPAGLGSGVRWALDRSDASLLVLVDEPTAVADAYALCKMVWRLDPGYPLASVVNMADGPGDAQDVAHRFSALTGHFLNRKVLYAGWVPFSGDIRRSVRIQTPAVDWSPELTAAFSGLGESIRCGVFDSMAPAALN